MMSLVYSILYCSFVIAANKIIRFANTFAQWCAAVPMYQHVGHSQA